MNIGIIGSGGREHALCFKLKQSKIVDKIYCMPGNAGTNLIAENLDIEKVLKVISKGSAQSWQMENRYRTMLDNKFDFGFAVDWMRKDLSICLEEAKKNNAKLPITKIIDKYYSEVQNNGGNRWDTSSLISLLK